jgi:hypothetical protein
MIKRQCLFHLFQRNPGSKMVSDNLNSGHFGYTHYNKMLLFYLIHLFHFSGNAQHNLRNYLILKKITIKKIL